MSTPASRCIGVFRAAALLGVLGAGFLASSCSDVTAPELEAPYALLSIGGDTVPISLDTAPGFEYEILEQFLIFRSGGTYQAHGTARATDGIRSFHTEGSYRRSGNVLVLTSPGGASTTLEISGGVLSGHGLPYDGPQAGLPPMHIYRRINGPISRRAR